MSEGEGEGEAPPDLELGLAVLELRVRLLRTNTEWLFMNVLGAELGRVYYYGLRLTS